MEIIESWQVNVRTANTFVSDQDLYFKLKFHYLLKKTLVNNNERNDKRFNSQNHLWPVADSGALAHKTQPGIECSKLAIEALEQGEKYVQS